MQYTHHRWNLPDSSPPKIKLNSLTRSLKLAPGMASDQVLICVMKR
jgi:hypothetical protein